MRAGCLSTVSLYHNSTPIMQPRNDRLAIPADTLANRLTLYTLPPLFYMSTLYNIPLPQIA